MNEGTGRVAVLVTALVWVVSMSVAIPYLDDDTGSTNLWAGGDGLVGVALATHVDGLAASLLILAASVAFLVQIYSTAYLDGDPRYRSYAALVLLFALAMITVVVADDLFVLLIGWEIMGICSYLLISHHWELPAARAGAVKAFLMTRFGDVGLLIAILVIGQTFDTYRISYVLDRVEAGAQPPQLTAIGLLLLLAVIGKSAQFPLHTWLPDAMPGPTPISALIHAATMVAAGVYLIARLFPLFEATELTMTLLAIVASITMLLGALFALVQSDLKRVLAWSTVSQLAYMFAALSVGGRDAGTDHLLSHGAFKALLFLSAGCIAHAIGSTGLASMGGLRRQMPTVFWTATIGFAALAGVVPTAGFFTKDAVLESVYEATHGEAPVSAAMAWVVLVVGLATVLITAAYAARAWLMAFFGEHAATEAVSPQVLLVPRAMRWPLVVLAGATLALSIGQELHWQMGLISSALVAIGAFGAYRSWSNGRDPALLTGRARPWLRNELGIDHAYDALADGVMRGGDVVVAGDRDVVDFYPRSSSWIVHQGSALMTRAQSGNVQTYATVFGTGALLVVVATVVGR